MNTDFPFSMEASASTYLAPPAQPMLAAIVYPNEAYPREMFARIVAVGRERGVTMAGVLQHPASADPSRHCDVILEDLMSGERTELFENRGSGARGCRLDMAALTQVTARIERALMHDDPAFLVLTKFGKAEAEGGGFVDAIATAIDREIPVIVGVSARNLVAWRDFVGDLAVEFGNDMSAISAWCTAAMTTREPIVRLSTRRRAST